MKSLRAVTYGMILSLMGGAIFYGTSCYFGSGHQISTAYGLLGVLTTGIVVVGLYAHYKLSDKA